ncbi:MerR family transcriptional regulator [Caulobacter sp. SLTY]|uniref:MerR family transcriptional regulator n=1 Tax=Caulobacter sp. SLTY TaxID=2683262 RepID=UPI00141359A5|nr:MerR family transcriptional regulator [Caulobacter sp. SLTY]NBB14405.1 MerR family transcriptional regulator [Caulobacter sp. SLTY]
MSRTTSWRIDKSMIQVCLALALTPRAVRFYEQRGLLCPERDAQGRRRYGPDAMARLEIIARARRAGLSLDNIGAILAAGDRDGAAARDALMADLCADRLRELDAERAELLSIVGGLSRPSIAA